MAKQLPITPQASKPFQRLQLACLLICAALVGSAVSVQGQDLHSSQPYALPMLTNVAQTGDFDGIYRASLAYRDQWRSVTVPYQTFSFAAEGIWEPNTTFNLSRFGLGMVVSGDQAGDGALSTNSFGLNFAYHQGFDPSDKAVLSLGYGIGLGQKSIDFTKLTFDSQWSDEGFDPNLPTNETNTTNTTSYFDMQAGLQFRYKYDQHEYIYFGAAAAHLNSPTVSFYGAESSLDIRPTAVIGGKFGLRNTTAVHPMIQFSTQSSAREILAGANFSYGLNYKVTGDKIYLGAWHRYKDAIIFTTGFELKRLQLLFSYDLNVSKLSASSNGNGAFEFSLVYRGIAKKSNPIDCPRY